MIFFPVYKAINICILNTWIAMYKEFCSIQNVVIFSHFTCGYSLEVPYPSTSNEYPQCMSLWRNKKNIYPDTPLIWSYGMDM